VWARGPAWAPPWRRYAREGLTVAVTSRSPEQLERVVHEIRAAGGTAHALPGDASREQDVQALEARLAGLGTLRAPVYNAAAGHRAPTLELSAEQFEEAWRVSTLGAFLVGRAALRLQLPQGRGSLIFTGATAALRGRRPPFAAFASAKAGLRSLAQSLWYRPFECAHSVRRPSYESQRRQAAQHRAAHAALLGLKIGAAQRLSCRVEPKKRGSPSDAEYV
jgi:NAD(P)-dependent dehydrogenase (short-subunit alcohol dehydrogenase family)